jgi:Arc/MetJ-type ribon-helix-helix transcriptional regulator
MAMTVSPENQCLLNDLVASGEFRSQDEALAVAIRFLRERTTNGSSSQVDILPPDEWIKEWAQPVARYAASGHSSAVSDSR